MKDRKKERAGAAGVSSGVEWASATGRACNSFDLAKPQRRDACKGKALGAVHHTSKDLVLINLL